MATSMSELAGEIAERFDLREDDARFLLMFGDHRPIDGDEPAYPDDPTTEDMQAWQEKAVAAHDAMHWTVAGITRNIKSVLSRRGDRALTPNEAAPLRELLVKVEGWGSSGVLQRVADFVAGVRASGAGEILSNAPTGVVANLLTALDPALLAKDTLERLKEDIEGGSLPVPRRLQDAFNEMEDDILEEMAENSSVLRPPTTTRH